MAAAGVGQGGAAAQLAGAAPKFVNAALDTRAVTNGLGETFRAIVAAQQQPAWIGYAVPARRGGTDDCEGCEPWRCGVTYLERRRPVGSAAGDRTVALEAPAVATLLFRVERAAVQKVRVITSDCDLDAGGLPVRWLTGVVPAESVALLTSMIGPDAARPRGASPSENAILAAIAVHADPSATRSLAGFVAEGQPAARRKQAAFWLGSARGREGFEILRRLSGSDSSDAFRRDLAFPISTSREPGAIDLLIKLAREDANREVRKQALFWLGQKAGAKATATLGDAAASDPETSVKEQAVFALSRLPNDEGVPKLIEVARANPDLAVRKRAMFWLGQKDDPRALDFLVEVLRK
jgi:hypothetical protein